MIAHGKDSSNLVVPILVDSAGRVIIDASQPSTLYPASVTTQGANGNLPAGTSSQSVVTVPAGQLWRMTYFTMIYAGTVAGVTMTARVSTGSSFYNFFRAAGLTSGAPNTLAINVLLEAGWEIQVVITGATLNDDYSAVVWAERIR